MMFFLGRTFGRFTWFFTLRQFFHPWEYVLVMNFAEKMMDALREKLMRDFATSSGSFVSGRETMPLPWWMAK